MKTRKSHKPHTRVIAGKIKGKLIEFAPGKIRPMTSRVKKALFDIIGDCTGMNMLDLFTGSGNICIEAYSRGIESADLVEMDFGKKKIIQKNLENAGFKNINLFIADSFLFCQSCSNKYDFIMLDPPFKWDKKEELIRIIGEKKLLKDNGFLVIHLPKKEIISEKIDELYRYDIRKYGLNMLLFYGYVEKLLTIGHK